MLRAQRKIYKLTGVERGRTDASVPGAVAVVETKRRRIVKLRMAFMEERVYLCLGHIKIM